MASRAPLPAEGDASASQHKANTISQPTHTAINDSSRVFGLDGASDRNGALSPRPTAHARPVLICPGYNARALSRSPSPYRRKRTRSPSPYRNKRALDRSPSPYRHGRADQRQNARDPRTLPKRKASPPRDSRSEKRPHTDRSRQGERLPRNRTDEARLGTGYSRDPQDRTDRSHGKPLSYEELEHPTPVPGYQDGLLIDSQPQKSARERAVQSSGDSRARSAQIARDNQPNDVAMYVHLVFCLSKPLTEFQDKRTRRT
jgi:serine/threonine-protein kinase PRP4